ncbi:unnamed protein product, partial [Ectocarpus sp. 8 AP-2014]
SSFERILQLLAQLLANLDRQRLLRSGLPHAQQHPAADHRRAENPSAVAVRGQGVLGSTPPHHQFPQQRDDGNSQRTREHDSVLPGARRRIGVHAWPARKGYAA